MSRCLPRHPTITMPGTPAPPSPARATGTGRLALARAVAAGTLSGAVLTAAVMWQCRDEVSKAAHHRPILPAALHLHATSARPPRSVDPVSVLVPVRHDTNASLTAVTAALGQRGVDRLDVVVLDEGCPADTRAALRREFGDDPRVRILSSAPLPRGWSIRAHRGHQFAVAARGQVLLFAEPGAPLGPHAAAAAAALLRGEGLDLAVLDSGRAQPEAEPPAATTRTRPGGSANTEPHRDGTPSENKPTPRVHTSSGTAGHFILPLRWGHHGHSGRFAVAVDAGAYWRYGGYRAVAGDADPLALLRTVRRAHGRVTVADGRRVIAAAPATGSENGDGCAARSVADSGAGRSPLTDTARRLVFALAGARR